MKKKNKFKYFLKIKVTSNQVHINEKINKIMSQQAPTILSQPNVNISLLFFNFIYGKSSILEFFYSKNLNNQIKLKILKNKINKYPNHKLQNIFKIFFIKTFKNKKKRMKTLSKSAVKTFNLILK